MINEKEKQRLSAFYQQELIENILSFWMPRCEDKRFGGYYNCFDNTGAVLVSHDKYTWSQGRFVWLFAKLAGMQGELFDAVQKQEFLRLAGSGRDFLREHVLIADDDYRCVYLMAEDGAPKRVTEDAPLDMSIYADCFVVLGMARLAAVSGDNEAYDFAVLLYESILKRVKSGSFHTLPYPLDHSYRAHGIPMILTNVTCELYDAALLLEQDDMKMKWLLGNLQEFSDDIINHFTDENHNIHEVISADHTFVGGLLGQHINPGHTIEDVWFQIEAAELMGRQELIPQLADIAGQALKNGWDHKYGGLFHYCCPDGKEPAGTKEERQIPVVRQVLDGWGDKLWWVHSEALYTSLLCYQKTGSQAFMDWHERVFEYTFQNFPNKDRSIREWCQILKRDRTPQDKVVALPVKDPFHIIRNLILILELLQKDF